MLRQREIVDALGFENDLRVGDLHRVENAARALAGFEQPVQHMHIGRLRLADQRILELARFVASDSGSLLLARMANSS